MNNFAHASPLPLYMRRPGGQQQEQQQQQQDHEQGAAWQVAAQPTAVMRASFDASLFSGNDYSFEGGVGNSSDDDDDDDDDDIDIHTFQNQRHRSISPGAMMMMSDFNVLPGLAPRRASGTSFDGPARPQRQRQHSYNKVSYPQPYRHHDDSLGDQGSGFPADDRDEPSTMAAFGRPATAPPLPLPRGGGFVSDLLPDAGYAQSRWATEVNRRYSEAVVYSERPLLGLPPLPVPNTTWEEPGPRAETFDNVIVVLLDVRGAQGIFSHVDDEAAAACFAEFFSSLETLVLQDDWVTKVRPAEAGYALSDSAYMVAVGLPINSAPTDTGGYSRRMSDGMIAFGGRRPARSAPVAAIQFCLDALASLQKINSTYGTSLEMTLGVQLGPVALVSVDGFAIYGETVHLAGALTEAGGAGQIHMSRPTYEHFRDTASVDLFVTAPQMFVVRTNFGEMESVLLSPRDWDARAPDAVRHGRRGALA